MAHYTDDNNQDIAHFLEKLNAQNPSDAGAFFSESTEVRPPSYDRSFEKLESKIAELEKRFESSAAQNKLILSELAHTRSELSRQKSRDAFLEHISRTIASLKNSVENLSRARQQSYGFYDGAISRTFDPVVPPVDEAAEAELRAERKKHAEELAEKERVFSSLRQKASQLKAVNSALDREIKKVQQEKLDALKKSAEQAKEILSLRDQLTAAEERFKSFNFEGRIISIKRQYEQKVSRLETQLKEISNTCMKQVEEIEALKAENLQLQHATKERDELQLRLQEAEKQVGHLKAEIAALEQSTSKHSQRELASFQEKLRALETQRDQIAAELETAKATLETVRQEKATLENNFKELLAKINHNDQVISDLKQKIEVLSAQNETLSQTNKELSDRNGELSQTNKELSDRNGELSAKTGELGHQNESLLAANRKLLDRNGELTDQNQTLSSRNEELSNQNSGLTRQNEALASKNETLSGQNDQLVSANKNLTDQNHTLSEQNDNLVNQNQMLSSKNEALSQQNISLSARNTQLTHQAVSLSQTAQRLGADNTKLTQYISKLSQDKHALEKENQTLTEKNRDLRSQSAALVSAHLAQQKHTPEKGPASPEGASSQPAKPVIVPVVKKASLAREASSQSSADKPAASTAQGAQEQLSQSKTAQEDLPEIRVNEPHPPLFESGEDFLKKTNSFIGRMRWSVFGEDK